MVTRSGTLSCKFFVLFTIFLTTNLSGFALDYESFIVDGIGYKILTGNTVAVTKRAQKITGEIAPAQSPALRRTAYVYSYVDVTYSGKVVIPATVTYGGIIYSVTTIEASCFSGCSSLTSITIPSTVTTVNKSAFYSCEGLKTVIIEDGSEEIGFDNPGSMDAVFYYCSIDSLYLGRNIKMLNNTSASNLFPGLRSVAMGDNVTTLPDYLFYSSSRLTAVHFGKIIESIGESIFRYCSKLESIDLTSKLKTIPYDAFAHCDALKTVILPQGLLTIGESAFSSCKTLSQITIPNTVTTVSKMAFYYCEGLKNVIIEDGSEEIGFDNPGSMDAVFYYCSIDSLYLGRNIKMLNNTSASQLFPGLRRVAMGDNVTELPDALFYRSSYLTAVHFGKNIASVGERIFEECEQLESIELPCKLTTIPYNAFYGCWKLKSVSLPQGLLTIGQSAFSSCGLESITIPNTVTTVNKNAFYYSSHLKTVIIEDGSEEIGFENERNYIFSACEIDSLYVGRDIKMLNNTSADGLFQRFNKLTIGTNVTNLLDELFSSTTLSKIYPLHENPITINKNVFWNPIYSSATLLVPGGTVKKYRATAAWNEFANIVPTAIGVTMTATAGGSIRLGDETVSNGTRLLQVKPNSVLTFEITPEETHFLTSVTMNGENVTAQVINGKFTPNDLSEDLEIEATFTAKPFYSVTATASGGGTATVGNGSVMWGKSTTVTLTANEGHQLKSITVNNVDKTSDVEDGVLTLDNIQASQAVVATFQKQRFAVTASACENGSISLSATEVEWDDDATATFTPAAHYEVAAVSINGEDRTAQLIGNQLTIEGIRQATTIGATFRLQTFAVTETHNAGGTVQLSAGTAQWGSSVTLTITPDDEHLLESVSVNGVDVTDKVANGEYAFTVEATTAVTVTFAAKPYYSVTVTSSAGGTATAASSSVMWGRSTTVTLTPDACYELKSLTVNGEDVTDEVVAGRLTLEDIREDQHVEATFGIITETITMATSSGAPREMKGYSSDRGLDFTHVTDVKAYIASFFTQDRTAYLTRIYVVPPHTGIVLKTTNPGVTVDVPTTNEDAYIANLLLPAVDNVTVKPTETIDGQEYRNLMVGMLSGTSTMGFVQFASQVVRSKNCYLRVPLAFYNSAASARAMDGLNMVFDDELETTDIRAIKEWRGQEDDSVYDLMGRKADGSRKGLVVKNGKLIYVKP